MGKFLEDVNILVETIKDAEGYSWLENVLQQQKSE